MGTFYVIRRKCSRARYLDCTKSFQYTEKIEDAYQAPTLSDLLMEYARRARQYTKEALNIGSHTTAHGGDEPEVVRVERVTFPETRKELSDTEALPDGAVLRYAVWESPEHWYNTDGTKFVCLEEPTVALFAKLTEVGRFEAEQAQKYTYLSATHRIVRIAVTPGKTEYKETVIS